VTSSGQALRTEQPNEITLGEEVSFLEQYLAIEQVRFSDGLRIQWNIEAVTRAAIVPSFILQPLLENAVKHGISQRADAGLIQVSAWLEGDQLYLSVRDDGYGIDPAMSKEGVGLGNTRERLTTLYGIEASVTLKAGQGGGSEVVVQLPYKQVKR
jgi:two-component system, LytTR family, sensor kinase